MGGAEMQVAFLVGRLMHLGSFDVHYVARNIDPTHTPTGYCVHQIPSYKAVSGTFVLDVANVLRLLRKLQPDVIYQRVGCAYTGVATYFARKYQRRIVWHVSSDRDLMPLPWRVSWRSPLEQLNKEMIHYGARCADVVVVQNTQQAELLRTRFGRSDAVYIPNFHPAPTMPMKKPSDRVTVCWVGNLKPLKQPDVFLRLAFDFRHRSDVEFVVVGAPQMRGSAWKNLAANMGDLRNLTYAGPMSQAAVGELLSAAHVLVNTSVIEGFPNTFIQSWLREVPVVSLTVNPDGVFDDDRYGMCAQGDYDLLRESVERLISDALLRKQIGLRARLFARERFSEGNVDHLIALLGPT